MVYILTFYHLKYYQEGALEIFKKKYYFVASEQSESTDIISDKIYNPPHTISRQIFGNVVYIAAVYINRKEKNLKK